MFNASLPEILCRYKVIPNVYTPALGFLRAGLAFAHLLTLCSTSTNYLIRPVAGNTDLLTCSGIKSASMYCLVPESELWLVRCVGIAICLVCITGYLPRLSSLLFFWLSFSAFNSWVITDGGDQVILNVSLMLCLLNIWEPRKNQWAAPEQVSNELRLRIGYIFTALIKIQVFALYFQAGVAKGGVDNWANGTEIYYDVLSPMFGANALFASILEPILSLGIVVQTLTWGTMVAEVFIAFAIFGTIRTRLLAWVLALSLHVGIAVIMGIVSFSCAMITIATFALLPFGYYFKLDKEGVTQNAQVPS